MKTRLYRQPKLYYAGGDLSKRWFVHFHYWDEALGGMKRYRLYADLHSYSTKRERTKAGRLLLKALVQLLQSGWSPYAPTPAVAAFAHPASPSKEVQDTPQPPPRKQPTVPPAKAAKPQITLKKLLANAYSERTMGACKKTAGQYKGYFALLSTQLQAQGLLDMPPDALDAAQAQQCMQALKNRKQWSNTNYNKMLLFYRGLFRQLVQHEHMARNPFEHLKKLKGKSESHQPYKPAQIAQLSAYFKAHDAQLFAFTRFIFYAFIRPEELRNLRVGDVDMANRIIRIPAVHSKTFGRKVDICKPLYEFILESKLPL